jgi:hypothetical protein
MRGWRPAASLMSSAKQWYPQGPKRSHRGPGRRRPVGLQEEGNEAEELLRSGQRVPPRPAAAWGHSANPTKLQLRPGAPPWRTRGAPGPRPGRPDEQAWEPPPRRREEQRNLGRAEVPQQDGDGGKRLREAARGCRASAGGLPTRPRPQAAPAACSRRGRSPASGAAAPGPPASRSRSSRRAPRRGGAASAGGRTACKTSATSRSECRSRSATSHPSTSWTDGEGPAGTHQQANKEPRATNKPRSGERLAGIGAQREARAKMATESRVELSRVE